MMFLLALLFVLVGDAGAKIQWKFQNGNESDGFGIFLDVEIGTPGRCWVSVLSNYTQF
jgi:hypothetical protein